MKTLILLFWMVIVVGHAQSIAVRRLNIMNANAARTSQTFNSLGPGVQPAPVVIEPWRNDPAFIKITNSVYSLQVLIGRNRNELKSLTDSGLRESPRGLVLQRYLVNESNALSEDLKNLDELKRRYKTNVP